MQNFIDRYNAVTGAVIALFTALFGIYWYAFAAYLFLNIIDWVTGWIKARKQHKESSKIGLWGAIKKVGYWFVIAIAFVIANVFTALGKDVLGIDLSILYMLGWFTLAMLLVNEIRSILENFVELGYEVPQVLISGLAITEKMLNSKINKETEGKE